MMKQLDFGTGLMICMTLTLGGCDHLYRLLDKEGAQEKELIGAAVPFERNPTIEEIQILLKLYGYNPGEPDGVLGLRTRNAIERFQKDNSLKQSRFVDEETWQKLNVFKENGLIQENQLNAVLIQKLLKRAGYNLGTADGKFGPRTLTAIKTFQKANGLEPDGKIGYKTLSKLAVFLSEEK